MSSRRSSQGTTEKAALSTTSKRTVVKNAAKDAGVAEKSRWQRVDPDAEAKPAAAIVADAPTEKAAKKPKAPAPPPVLDDDSGDLVVFAFRMTRAEREEIHDAAGPAKASRFTRTVVLAAARGDLATIQTAVKETRKAAAS